MRTYRPILAALLTAALMLSLCVTGFAADAASTGDGYVYTAQETTISEGKESYNPLLWTKDGVYCTRREVIGQREAKPGEAVEYEGQLDVSEYRLYFISNDGTVTRLEAYDPGLNVECVSPSSNAREPDIWISQGAEAPNGNLILLISVFETWSNAGDDVPMYSDEWYSKSESSERYFLRVLSPQGEEISLTQIEMDAQNSYISGMVCLDDSSVLLAMDDQLCRVGIDGTVTGGELSCEGWIDDVMDLDGEHIGIVCYSDTLKVDIVDRRTLEVTDTASLGYSAYNVIPGSGDYLVYYFTGTSLSGYNRNTGESERLFQWLDLDVNYSQIGNYHAHADGSFTAVVNNWNNKKETYTTGLLRVLQVPQSSLPEKKQLTLAAEYVDYNLSEQILNFNRSHSDIRIHIVSYDEYNTEDDWEAGRTKLTTEILAGQMPDLLVLNGLPSDHIAAKGLLEDLFPYIDSDPELDRADYFENVLSAMSRGGKLYSVIPSFTIRTMVGAKSIVGDGIGWTYDEVYQALELLPEGAEILSPYTTQEEMLSTLLDLNMNELVDWSTGRCSFNTPEFAEMLKFAKHFKSEFDWDSYEWTEEDSQDVRIQNGKQLLLNAYIWSFEDSIIYGSYFGGEDNVSFIGYPSSTGTPGSVFSMTESGIGMSAKCADKQVAWEFLRMFLTEEYQSSVDSLPIHRGAFEEKLQEAMTPDYKKDANGNRILNADGEYEMWPKITYYDGNKEVNIYSVSEEQAQQLRNMVESIDRCQSSDESITQIVLEQSAAFFAGQKSAEEVAKLIQSKASIYINEQM